MTPKVRAPSVSDPGTREILPASIFTYVWRASGKHQLALVALSVAAFLLSAAPLEFQRRIVNDAVARGAINTIFWLAVGYAAVALAEGAVKLALNIYRGWVSENAVRELRKEIHSLSDTPEEQSKAEKEGVQVSLVLAETEPIGGFIGISVSEPVLQFGILISIFGYMAYLQPELALLAVALFSPQLFFVPLLQKAINRRVEMRIQTLRKVSGGIIDDEQNEAAQDKRIDRVFGLNMGIYRLRFSMSFLMNAMHHLGIATVLAVGGWYAATGKIEVGTVVASVSGLTKVNDPWRDVVSWYREMMVSRVKYALIAKAVARLQDKQT